MAKVDLAHAARLLQAGECVAIPTETVYGLAADASNAAAVQKIFALKGRPSDHPLIVHVADATAASQWASDWTAVCQALAQAFWPGPLTLIVPKAHGVLAAVTGGQASVGLRVPAQASTLALLNALSPMGLAAPSANRYGHVSPTTAAHVVDELGEDLAILDDAQTACDVGIESTILDCTVVPHRILRPGAIDALALAEVLGYVPTYAHLKQDNSTRASGDKLSHYAPHTPAHLVAKSHPQAINIGFNTADFILPDDPKAYAHELYATLRLADELAIKKGLARIAIMAPPNTPEWTAVRDRLSRATYHA